MTPGELPETLRRLVDLLGWDKAVLFTQRFGGVRVYVPETMTPEHQFARLVGMEGAQKLVDEFGGEGNIPIPKADAALRQVRNAAILDGRAQGKTVRNLALEYRLTERQIYALCGEAEPGDARQMDLMGGDYGRS